MNNTIIFDSKNLQKQQLLCQQWSCLLFKIKNCCMRAHSHKLSNLCAIGCCPKISIHLNWMLLARGINSTPRCTSETIYATNDTICVNCKQSAPPLQHIVGHGYCWGVKYAEVWWVTSDREDVGAYGKDRQMRERGRNLDECGRCRRRSGSDEKKQRADEERDSAC